MRRHPIGGDMRMHHGIDVACPIGTELVAPADGEVVHKGKGGTGGFTLILKHASDLFTVYYHLKKASHLNIGDEVKRGELCALSGNTGGSTGPHLHFETRRSKKWGDTFDPLDVLDLSRKPQEPLSEPQSSPAPQTKAEPAKPAEKPVAPKKPSMLNRVAPGLAAWHKSWERRGKK